MDEERPSNADAPTSFSFKLKGHVVGVGGAPDSAHVSAPAGTETVIVLDARDVNVVPDYPQAHAVGALTLDWAEGGLATGGQDGKVRLWDASRGTVLVTFDTAESNRSTWVEQVRWSPDGTLLAGRASKVLRIWKPDDGDSCLKYGEHSTTISALCWRPDSKGIAVGFYGGARFYRLSHN